MVVEYLSFQIEPSERDAWLRVEEQTWSRFLERQPGFVSKQMWVERDHPGEVFAVITWRDEASWHSIPADELAAVDASMGAAFLNPTACRVFDVIRDS